LALLEARLEPAPWYLLNSTKACQTRLKPGLQRRGLLFPDREPPADLIIIDCIEFNERFRFADPVADMAFLAMDSRKGDASDADRAVYEKAAQGWEEMSALSGRALLEVRTDETRDEALSKALSLLRDSGLMD
jgi:hypothetical protein